MNAKQNETFTHGRVYMKEAVDRQGNTCYIGKMRKGVALSIGTTREQGDEIIIGNTTGRYPSGISKTGRWDITIKRMDTGAGWIVTAASFCFDKVSIEREGNTIRLLVNGQEGKLKVEGTKRFIPLFFSSENYRVKPEIVADNILQKLQFLQLEDLNAEEVAERFLQEAKDMDKEYLAEKKKERAGKREENTGDEGNTLRNECEPAVAPYTPKEPIAAPAADWAEKTLQSQIDKFKDKYNKKK